MTVVRKFFPEVRLKRLLAQSGGLRARDAIAAAERGVESIRGDCLEAIDRKIEEISVIAVAEPPDLSRSYRLANEIFAEAGTFDLTELSQAAVSLCELLGASDVAHVPREAIRVHVDSMRALRSPAMAAHRELRAAVLQELRALNKRLTPHV